MDINDTLQDRKHTHGSFTVQAATQWEMERAMMLHRVDLSPSQHIAIKNIIQKLSRIRHGNPDEPDHWHDIIGYATLVKNELVEADANA